jgi:hypothetical protein
MRALRFLTVMVSIGCSALGQSGAPGRSGPETGTGQVRDDVKAENLTTYEDKEDGFQLKYPSFLQFNGLEFRNLGGNDFVTIQVSVASVDPKPYLKLGKNVPVSVKKQVFNHLKWVNYSYLGGATYCAYRNHELLCMEGVAVGAPGKQLSSVVLGAMQEIESTLIFTDVSFRMDSRIAALKIGDRFGGLRVGRVVTRSMADGNRKKYWENPFGEVDFNGSLTLTGYIENNQSMNSGPDWVISPDPESCALLPQVGHPIDFAEYQGFEIHFNNEDFVEQQVSRYRDGKQLTIVVNNLSEIYYPAGGLPYIRADLVRIVDNR